MKNPGLILIAVLCLLNLSCNKASDSPKQESYITKQTSENATETFTPIQTIKAFIEACQTRNVEAVALNLSKASFRLAEERAKKENKTVAELLNNCNFITQTPGAFNEKIYSDSATVDVQNIVTRQYDKISLVKEKEVWKIAIDQFEADLQKKVDEDLNKKDEYYSDEEDKIRNKYRIKIAEAESQPTYSLEAEKNQLLVKRDLDREEYKEKVALVNSKFAAKKKILDNAEAIRKGIFFRCLIY